MAKHLLDETAEFKMPTIGRHGTDDEIEGPHATRPLDGARAQARVPGRHQADSLSR